MSKGSHSERPKPPVTVYTVGHSTHSLDEFLGMLQSHKIHTLVDVRSFPGSRRYPQFNKVNLAESLTQQGLEYQHLLALGGRRRPYPDSQNVAWKNASFRAYADHIETNEFKAGVQELLELAAKGRVAIMCAEALWWRCHRSLIADFLMANGVEVLHIINQRKVEPHKFTSAASIVEGKLSYRGLL